MSNAGWGYPGSTVTLHHLLDAHYLIEKVGLFGLFGIVFAETGLLVGFFLPGDSLLVLAGVLSSPGKHAVNVHFPLFGVLVGCFVAAVAGAETGYLIGRKAGPALFNRPSSRFFKPDHVEKAQGYFDRYGNRTIVVARFVPIVRTFANPVAGVSKMESRSFAGYNLIGALLWTVGVVLAGYFIGNSVKDTYLIPGVILVSLLPIGVEALRHRRRSSSKTVAV